MEVKSINEETLAGQGNYMFGLLNAVLLFFDYFGPSEIS